MEALPLMFSRGALLAVLCFGASGCSSKSPEKSNLDGSTPETSNFDGPTPWTGTIAATVSCAGQTETGGGDFDVTFSPLEATGLTYTTVDGCIFDFSVSGDTATLANGPVACSAEEEAGVLLLDYQSLTFTSPDGVTLSGTGSGTLSENGTTCTETLTITASR
jgi:hypothetical protein